MVTFSGHSKGHWRKDPALPANAQRTLPPLLDSGAALLEKTGCHLPSGPTGRGTGRALFQSIPQEMSTPASFVGSAAQSSALQKKQNPSTSELEGPSEATCYSLFVLQQGGDKEKPQREGCPEAHGGQWKSHT